MKEEGSISIWFFVGIALTVNGTLILAAGLYELVRPLANPPVLYQLHANVWWGTLLLVIGAVYCYAFPPSRGAPKR